MTLLPFKEPHEAERAVIHMLVTRPESTKDKMDYLNVTDQDFSPERSELVETLLENEYTDIVTAEQYIPREQFKAISGYESDASKLDEYLKTIQNASQRRQVHIVGTMLSNGATYPDREASELVADAEIRLSKIDQGPEEQKSLDDVLHGIVREADLAEIGQGSTIPTTFPGIDKWMQLERHGYYVVKGAPGHGKTSMIRNMVLNQAQMGVKVALFSLEQTEHQLRREILATLAGLNCFDVVRGRVAGGGQLLAKEIGKMKALSLTIYDGKYDALSLRSAIKRAVFRDHADVIVVDYLQAIKGPANIYERICINTETLRECAKEFGAPVVVLSALSADGQTRGGAETEYDAFGILKIEKSRNFRTDHREHIVSVEKNRFGPCSGQSTAVFNQDGSMSIEN